MFILFRALASVLALTLTTAAFAQQSAKVPTHQIETIRPLMPIFSSIQSSSQFNMRNGPQFGATFTNDTRKIINLWDLLEASSMILDSKEYKRNDVLFAGISSLFPGRSSAFTVSPGDYLPDAEIYDQTRKVWLWTNALKSGTHTVTFKFGGKMYGPANFVWNNTPLPSIPPPGGQQEQLKGNVPDAH